MFTLGEMTAGGREQAIVSLDKLRAEGATNLWGGLLTGMDSLRVGGGVVVGNG